VEQFNKEIEACAILGCKNIVVHPICKVFRPFREPTIPAYDDDDFMVNMSQIKKLVPALKEFGVKIYVRGIRNRTDLKFENAMKKKNKELYPFIKTRYIKCPKKYKSVSSTLVKEYIKSGQDFLDFVPESIRNSIIKIISKKTKKD
jgi:hypothetical protein